jgi:hypothetical protein
VSSVIAAGLVWKKHRSRFYVGAEVNEVSLWRTSISMSLCGLMLQYEAGGYHELAGIAAANSLIK